MENWSGETARRALAYALMRIAPVASSSNVKRRQRIARCRTIEQTVNRDSPLIHEDNDLTTTMGNMGSK